MDAPDTCGRGDSGTLDLHQQDAHKGLCYILFEFSDWLFFLNLRFDAAEEPDEEDASDGGADGGGGQGSERLEPGGNACGVNHFEDQCKGIDVEEAG